MVQASHIVGRRGDFAAKLPKSRSQKSLPNVAAKPGTAPAYPREPSHLNDDSTAPSCQIYAIVDTADAAPERLAAILAAAPVACVLLRRRAGASADAPQVKALVEACQKQDVAALVEGDATLARTLRADGVHLPWSTAQLAALAEAREILGARAMVGVEVAAEADDARHVAMELAEAGADYVAFGPGERQGELIDWWAPIFEVPCVAFDLASPQAAADAAAAGADFVTVTALAGTSPSACASQVSAVATALAPSALTEQRS